MAVARLAELQSEVMSEGADHCIQRVAGIFDRLDGRRSYLAGLAEIYSRRSVRGGSRRGGRIDIRQGVYGLSGYEYLAIGCDEEGFRIRDVGAARLSLLYAGLDASADLLQVVESDSQFMDDILLLPLEYMEADLLEILSAASHIVHHRR